MDYELRRSARRKTLAIAVKADGSVVVHAPQRLAEREILRFVESHGDWIARAVARRAAYNAAHPEPTAEQREELMERARSILPQRVAIYTAQMGLQPTAVRITSALKSISYSRRASIAIPSFPSARRLQLLPTLNTITQIILRIWSN